MCEQARKPFATSAKPAGSRRRRVWELPDNCHCPVIGVCLPIDTIAKAQDRSTRLLAEKSQELAGVQAQLMRTRAELQRRIAVRDREIALLQAELARMPAAAPVEPPAAAAEPV